MPWRGVFILALSISAACSNSSVEQISVQVPAQVKVPPDMVYIPAGEFIMGDSADPKTRGGEKVRLPAYLIDRYEMSVGKFRAAQTGAEMDGKDAFPATQVSFHRAEEFCARNDKRLPTEAEWEKAARGTDGRKWPWNIFLQHPNDGFSGFIPEPVDKRKEWISPYGVYGMNHNVWEWTADWYDYNGMPEKDARKFRTLRGGLMQTHTAIGFSTVYFRNWMAPEAEYNFIGFRCAKDAS
jgi:formylglycine-generating enzyme required for sulfatase activity